MRHSLSRSTRPLSFLLTPVGVLLLVTHFAHAEPNNPNTDWFNKAHYGIFMHFLPADARGLALVEQFEVEALANQLEEAGAKYFVITLGQNSGYFNSPNAAYDRYTSYAPGERCAKRDLPLDLYRALRPKNIKLMLYLPCQTPNQDARAQKAFGLRQGRQDQPIDLEFAKKWAEVIQEWAERYGNRVAGWWFDGAYEHVRFNEAIAQVYAQAVKRGNPKGIVTFNPGVRVIHYTQSEDYTAGELNEPFAQIPSSRWLDGSQWHALTFLGSTWGQRDTRYTETQWADWVRAVTGHGGVVTLDMGPNYDSAAGPIGTLAPAQLKQVASVKIAVSSPGAASPKRLKRAESFLGVHFDFHAGPDCTEIGKNTTREMIEAVINQVQPDYLQIDCKGHPGLSSYPTKAGNPAPGFVGDPLRLWRQVTAEHGVALYMHYSGVWDSEAIRQHPGWAVINADGTTNKNANSFFGPYADRLLVPQLRELAGVYGVDGAWIDGECWASVPDYSAGALRAFHAATGLDAVPRKPGDPHWFEFLQFNREAFRRYLRHYINEVKKTNPDFQLCSNWAFTDHMPEPVSAPIDFLSGDYNPEDSVNSARISARYLARQGKPWDLMAWSFTRQPDKNGNREKTAVQLEREAAAVLALGGGFQAYFTQKRDGSVRLERVPVMAEVAKFCRARQPFCHHAIQIPQIALLYSTEAHYRRMNGLFARDPAPFSGILQALLENQQSVELLGEHHLTGRMAEYPLIIIPEWEYLDPKFKSELTTYVREGGNLLLIGPKTAALFQSDLDVKYNAEASIQPHYLVGPGGSVLTKGYVQSVTLGRQARPFGQLQDTNMLDSPASPAPSAAAAAPTSSPAALPARLGAPTSSPAAFPAASITAVGRGRIAATYFSFSRGYLDARNPITRQFLADLVRQLFPKPLVEVKGSSDVDVVVNRLGGSLAINLVNTSGPHQTEPILESIAPVGPLTVILRQQAKPAKITLEPAGRSLAFKQTAGEIHFTVPLVDIYDIILVK